MYKPKLYATSVKYKSISDHFPALQLELTLNFTYLNLLSTYFAVVIV